MASFRDVEVVLPAEQAQDEAALERLALSRAGLGAAHLHKLEIRRRSIDARSRTVMLRLQVRLHLEPPEDVPFDPGYKSVHNAPEIGIVGMGPAGLFAALTLIRYGIKPVIFERGKDVRSRRRDLAALNKEHLVNPDSNYCFGEGGAGTYSDGKLYTRSHKRGSIEDVLQTFVYHGADGDILVDAHPHIGTNKLPPLIAHMRETLLACGAEIHFNARVVNFTRSGSDLKGVTLADGRSFALKHCILATGHSARDVFHLLHQAGLMLEAKPFALGVRAEHPQSLVDRQQYHCAIRPDYLPPASYSLVEQVQGEGVYSFCMCPGGIIAPCATSPGEVVTNGWSPSKRNNPFANSGIVVSITPRLFDPKNSGNPLSALQYQMRVEQAACVSAGNTQTAPAQRITDFVSGKASASLPPVSYLPGVASVNLHDLLPPEVADRLRAALPRFDKRIRGFHSAEGVLVAPESRTSSPVRIPRDKDTLQHPQVAGLYPCGEGAGYAGGIVSAALDGIACAKAVAKVVAPGGGRNF